MGGRGESGGLSFPYLRKEDGDPASRCMVMMRRGSDAVGRNASRRFFWFVRLLRTALSALIPQADRVPQFMTPFEMVQMADTFEFTRDDWAALGAMAYLRAAPSGYEVWRR